MHTMECQPVEAGEMLTERQARDVKAACARLGLTQKEAAKAHDISPDGVRKVLSQNRTCFPRYAQVFNDLLKTAGFSLGGDDDE